MNIVNFSLKLLNVFHVLSITNILQQATQYLPEHTTAFLLEQTAKFVHRCQNEDIISYITQREDAILQQAKQDAGSFHQFLTNFTEQLTVLCCKHVVQTWDPLPNWIMYDKARRQSCRNTCFKKDYSCEGEAIPALPEF